LRLISPELKQGVLRRYLIKAAPRSEAALLYSSLL
jgi:hypothetical protein